MYDHGHLFENLGLIRTGTSHPEAGGGHFVMEKGCHHFDSGRLGGNAWNYKPGRTFFLFPWINHRTIFQTQTQNVISTGLQRKYKPTSTPPHPPARCSTDVLYPFSHHLVGHRTCPRNFPNEAQEALHRWRWDVANEEDVKMMTPRLSRFGHTRRRRDSPYRTMLLGEVEGRGKGGVQILDGFTP